MNTENLCLLTVKNNKLVWYCLLLNNNYYYNSRRFGHQKELYTAFLKWWIQILADPSLRWILVIVWSGVSKKKSGKRLFVQSSWFGSQVPHFNEKKKYQIARAPRKLQWQRSRWSHKPAGHTTYLGDDQGWRYHTKNTHPGDRRWNFQIFKKKLNLKNWNSMSTLTTTKEDYITHVREQSLSTGSDSIRWLFCSWAMLVYHRCLDFCTLAKGNCMYVQHDMHDISWYHDIWPKWPKLIVVGSIVVHQYAFRKPFTVSSPGWWKLGLQTILDDLFTSIWTQRNAHKVEHVIIHHGTSSRPQQKEGVMKKGLGTGVITVKSWMRHHSCDILLLKLCSKVLLYVSSSHHHQDHHHLPP